MLIEGRFTVAAPRQALLANLFDARLMASCLPGCETLEPLSDDRYRAVVTIAMAGIKARFDLQVEITRRDESQIWVQTRGEEGGNASTLQADSRVSLDVIPEGTLVQYRSEVAVTGRLGRFALGMMKKKAQSLGDEFAVNLQRKLEAIGASTLSSTDAPAVGRSTLPQPALDDSVQSHSLGLATSDTASPPTGDSSLAQAVLPPEAVPVLSPVRVPDAPRAWWRKLLDWLRGGKPVSESSTAKIGD